mmetsp:Transcript_38660/g.120276  ORF Transcript_38660/g.120276 Transcript_38660/m.120276 type:complete len:244 (+) Transcript_38660:651-1382(+)
MARCVPGPLPEHRSLARGQLRERVLLPVPHGDEGPSLHLPLAVQLLQRGGRGHRKPPAGALRRAQAGGDAAERAGAVGEAAATHVIDADFREGARGRRSQEFRGSASGGQAAARTSKHRWHFTGSWLHYEDAPGQWRAHLRAQRPRGDARGARPADGGAEGPGAHRVRGRLLSGPRIGTAGARSWPCGGSGSSAVSGLRRGGALELLALHLHARGDGGSADSVCHVWHGTGTSGFTARTRPRR